MQTGQKARTVPGFGARLRQAREQRGLSQEALGRRIGCTRQQIYQYEQGQYSTSFASACALADALGVSLDTLAGRNGASHDPE
jgi:transcriptional regulator with XRE-family HTH domain